MSANAQDTVYGLFRAQAQRTPGALALQWPSGSCSYADLLHRVDVTAQRLTAHGIRRGMRLAVLSENRPEYTVVQLAAARLGAMVACMNWRLASVELRECLELVDPLLLAHSARYASAAAAAVGADVLAVDIEALTDPAGPVANVPASPSPDDGLLMIFTSGTTGRPRAAVISQRAEVARMRVLRSDLGIDADDAYIAWSPMYHMGGSEHTLASLMFGAPTVVCDGLDAAYIAATLTSRRVGWLLLVPASIDPVLAELRRAGQPVVGVKAVGCMADLVPAATIRELCAATRAPFLNSFGSTETGLPPLSGHLLPVGDALEDLGKRPSSCCDVRLVDGRGEDVASDGLGEALVRGATLFSGYWAGNDVDRSGFRGDWYPMGDLFRRAANGAYHFVGRSKYLIKSGGENIYPAEIERVLLDDPRVEDAAVVRKPDAVWGEIPVAFVVRRSDALLASHVEQLCRERLAGYKRPREVYFVDRASLPRNATGKIVREELERRALLA